jgi:hypothetical protein
VTCTRPGCGLRLTYDGFEDEGHCLVHGPQFIGTVFEEMRPGTDGARFSIKREPRHDSPNKLKQGTLR